MYDSKYLRIKSGDRIKLLESINDGFINLSILSEGKIVYHRNQVDADIWFYNMGLHYWDNPIRKKLEVSNQKLRGLVLNVEKKNFAVNYRYQDHKKIQIDSRKAEAIPFFKESDLLKQIPSNWYINNERGTEYLVDEVINVINDEFTEWVNKNLKTRKVYKYEKENGDFPEDWDSVLTDGSSKIYYEKRKELELRFAQATGLYYEFLGGLIFD